jgi:transcriptional regulator with XRE-family HTH domain
MLGGLVRRIMVRAGTQARAAQALGLSRNSQSYVSKLCRGKMRRVTGSTLAAIAGALVDDDERAALRRTVLTPFQESAVRHYGRWLREQAWPTGSEAQRALASEVADLYRDDRCGDDLVWMREELRKAVAGWATDDERRWRVAVAERRVLAPLMHGRASAGVERTVVELAKAGQLRKYLRAAVRAERVLLARPSAVERARDALPARVRKEVRRRPR